MASGGKESDDEIRRPYNVSKKNCKKILSSSETDEDSDLEIKPKRVQPLQCESDGNSSANELTGIISDNKLGAEATTDLSDNEQSEKCAICLSKFLGQDIATPETCDHVFCLECLQEWAKNVNTCPIDRLKFNIILIRHHKEEKIIKKIFVNNSEIPYNSELESESNTESQSNSCDVCNEDESEGPLLLCNECQKFYHYGCIPTLRHPHIDFWQCPTCENYIRIRDKFLLDMHRIFQGIKRRFSSARSFHRSRLSQAAMSQALRNPHVTTREFSRVRQRFLYQKSLVRSILSTSSSDEELDPRSTDSRFYQNQVVTNGSKSRCPLMSTKRRNELYRARNQRLLASATTAASANSQNNYTVDSDEGYSDFRLPSSPATENFDVVGSILQSQSLLHSPDVLTVSRDGSLLRNPSLKSSRTLLNLDSMSLLSHSGDNSESESPFANSSFFSDNAVSPYINKAVGKQIPLHSTQSNSKYGETPRQNYSCTSSSAPRERSLSYDECILSGSAFGGSGNERYNSDPNSPSGPKSFCCTSTSDDMKKTQPSNKDNKGHHSEDEVDIYSDIESVGEEDNSLSDQVEPAKISYKCLEESQQSDTNDVSDSTDNELVIDEDMPAEDENERIAESQGLPCNKTNNVVIDANDRASYQIDLDCGQHSILNENYDKYSSRISMKRSSSEKNTNKHDTQNTQMDESCSDDENQESDMEVQDEENSVDSTRKSYQGCGSNSCSVKSSPKSLTQCENSIYNEHDFCENDNSALEHVGKNTPEAPNSCTNDTNDSVSEMEVDQFHENNSNVSDSISHVEQPYKHKKYNFCVAQDRNEEVSHIDSNENSQIGANSNSSSAQSPRNNRILLPEESAISQSENNSHFSFSSNQQNADRSEPEDGVDSNDSNCGGSQNENSATFRFKNKVQSEQADCTDENSQNDVGEYLDESSLNETQPSTKFSKHEDSEGDNPANSNQNLIVDNDSHSDFSNKHQNDDESDGEDITDSNHPPSQVVTGTVTTETINISNDETVKSDNEYEDCESFEDASTPCLDENLEGEIENSPVQNVHCENANQEFSRTPDYEYENDAPAKQEDNVDDIPPDSVKNADVDLGIEDISEAGSEDLDEFPDEPTSEKSKSSHHSKASGMAENSSQYISDDNKKISDQAFEDQEEGEIIEDKPTRDTEKRKRNRYYDDAGDYVEHAPRMSISDLPRIPKLKRNREKDKHQEPPPFDNKRTSVLSRVDLGAGDVSWKRLSKHTRERSYRDGRPKDERLLYRERESRNKDRKNFDNNRRTDSKSSDRRRDDKKKGSEKSKSESRSRKNDKNKEDWEYSDRDKKKYKDHKDKYSKEKHSKDRKDKHDKNRYSKEESKYDREKVKDDSRYERESRYDKEDRFERAVYEKTKSKDKEHKSKRKDRKDESSKASKDHSREKHKHVHPHESYLDKKREVRKIDDKLKIVVGQKDRKEKSKTKERKDPKYEKEIHQRKRENERNAYSEVTSIESKEIFAKGDSIIINVSFNRNSSPKDVSTSDAIDINSSDQVSTMEDLDQDVNLNDELKNKSKSADKIKTSLDSLSVKRPVTPPERPNQVLSVSESYWQGGDDPDGNNSVASDKSDEESHHDDDDDDNDSVGSAVDADNFSNSSSSTDNPVNQEVKDGVLENEGKSNLCDEIVDKFSKEEDTFTSKRRSPRSPSPPSPADNDSYDPCEPTKSPSPPSMPAAPPLPLSNPKPPPSPELPPLPPEPEPTDISHEESHNVQNQTPPVIVSSNAQPVTVETQTPSSLAFTGMLLPPSFLSHSTQASNLPNITSLLPPRTMAFQVNSSNVLASNHMPPVMGANFMHTDTSLPPPPNPPNIPHMTSVPPPPPPPSAMGLLSQIRHPQLNVQPPLPPNSILQNLGLGHNLNIPQLQLPPIPHLPPNLCAALANHQSPLSFTSQNLPTSLPSNITSQQNTRFLAPNQVPLMPNQNISNNKPHVMSITQMLSHCQTIPVSSNQKSEQPSKPPTPGEKNEVIDMDVDSPYSPGDCSVDSVNDYSPSGSPLPSTPKETGDIFDTLFSADIRTSEKRPHDSVSKHERSKSRSGSKGTNESLSKKSKHDHRTDSKSRHSVKMQIEKNKRARKEQKIAEKILKLEDSQLKILDELPSSAVEMQVKEKFLKKLNRQERVIEEVKLALKPYYKSRDVNKEEYKDILRRAVPKICHNKSGEINPVKVKYLVECYIKKAKHSKKRSDKKKSKFS